VIYGRFRSAHPRISIDLPSREGALTIEFIVDTGFEGDLALPPDLVGRTLATPSGYDSHALADGRIEHFETQEIEIDWAGDKRITEVLVIGGEPLVGTTLLSDMHLHVEMAEGGDVSIEPL